MATKPRKSTTATLIEGDTTQALVPVQPASQHQLVPSNGTKLTAAAAASAVAPAQVPQQITFGVQVLNSTAPPAAAPPATSARSCQFCGRVVFLVSQDETGIDITNPESWDHSVCSLACGQLVFHKRCAVDELYKNGRRRVAIKCNACKHIVEVRRDGLVRSAWKLFRSVLWWLKFSVLIVLLLGYVSKTAIWGDALWASLNAGNVTMADGSQVNAYHRLPWAWNYRYSCSECRNFDRECRALNSPLIKYFHVSRGFWPDGCHMLLGMQLYLMPFGFYFTYRIMMFVWERLPIRYWTRKVTISNVSG